MQTIIHTPKTNSNSSLSDLNIVHILDALKIAKCRRRSRYDLYGIDFDDIVIKDVKYLPSTFDGDVIFAL